MSETDPGYSEQHAGNVGARRATVGTPTDGESINIPQTRAGAAENARKAEAARQEHETFVPEPPIPDDQSEAARSSHGSGEGSVRGTSGEEDEEDEDDVRKDIQKTRRELGDTVSALAEKADVKARASHAAERAKDRAAHAADAVKVRATDAAGAAKGHAADAAGAVKVRATDAADVVKGKATEVAGKIQAGTPHQVKDVATQAKKRPMILVVVAGVVTAFVVRRVLRRRRGAR